MYFENGRLGYNYEANIKSIKHFTLKKTLHMQVLSPSVSFKCERYQIDH